VSTEVVRSLKRLYFQNDSNISMYKLLNLRSTLEVYFGLFSHEWQRLVSAKNWLKSSLNVFPVAAGIHCFVVSVCSSLCVAYQVHGPESLSKS
jgi:hypothetical protein